MSPEPSFTQALREEGFIQGSGVESKVNETKEEVVNKVEETKAAVEETKVAVEETKTKAQSTANQAKNIADTTVKSTSNDSFIGKLIDTIKNIF